jgi:hypothetical protein
MSSVDAGPLPLGFREEVGDRGMLMPWCCQIEVLAYPAIGGFLTHCGVMNLFVFGILIE